MASSVRHSLSRSCRVSCSSYQRRTFSASKLRHGPGFFNLGATATAKETQYFSKLSGLGVLNHSPTLEAIKNSEVDPFKKKSGTESTSGDKDSGTKNGLKDSGPYTKIEPQWWIHPTERTQTPETRDDAAAEQSAATEGDLLDKLDDKLVSLQSRLRELKQRWDDSHRGAENGNSDVVSRIKADMAITRFRLEAAITLLEARSDLATVKRMQKLRNEAKANEEEKEEKEEVEEEEQQQEKGHEIPHVLRYQSPLATISATMTLLVTAAYLAWCVHCIQDKGKKESSAKADAADADGPIKVSILPGEQPDERCLLIRYKNSDKSQKGEDALLNDVLMQLSKSTQAQNDSVLHRWLNSWLWIDSVTAFEQYNKEGIRRMAIKEAQIKKQETVQEIVESKR